jgi:tellurium resistance protein TerZ
MTTINLTKGQKISLTKGNGQKLEQMCIGVNWGAIQKKGFFGGSSTKDVDLDASVGVFDSAGNLLEKVYFGNLSAKGIKHSGDDTEGDSGEDDGLDNEVISIDLARVHPQAAFLGLVLNSYTHIKFDDIPFASIRIYEGTPSRVDNVVAKFEISNSAEFKGKECMIMGGIYKNNGEWKFNSIGQATDDRNLEGLLSACKSFIR